MKAPDPNSIRTKRRIKRNFTKSRAAKRAERRLNTRLNDYNKMPENRESGFKYNKPGKLQYW